jgi:hypothetical protein
MALQVTISAKELERVAGLAYEGETISVMLCSLGGTEFDENTLISSWETTEVTGSGYERYTGTIGTGTYNSTSARYELPDVFAEFTSTDSLAYDRIVVFIGTSPYPYAVLEEDPNILLSAGQTQTYKISLNCDD